MQITGRRGCESSGHTTSVARIRGDSIRSTSDRRDSESARAPYSRRMVCPRCGIEVSEHQKFCHGCGTPIESRQADASTDPTTSASADAVTEPIAATEPADVTEPVDLVATTEMAELEAPTERVELTSPPSAGPAEPPWFPETRALGARDTAEMPALFDGHDDLVEYPPAREPFRVRIIFPLALFGTAAVLMSIVADVIDISTAAVPNSASRKMIRTRNGSRAGGYSLSLIHI